ncbi:hypothetical protein PR202_ga15476 [Eleusine coracana subsp. coracana]|uniref:RRM domain-containing protein n=1 Tax=Eleusine coracana subsp. coracana TaxID=191504 RepID=A0AAV5CKA0_ELECO|nr:hypothetical protein PR202_ga15476 [Eleusine coracana subsp. coracana]
MSSSVTTAAAQQHSTRRDGFAEDNGVKLDGLPPRVVIGPDENGVKKVIEYRFDKGGQHGESSNFEGPQAVSISAVPMAACKICSTTGDHWTSKCPILALQFKTSSRGGGIKGLYPPPIIREAANKNGDDVKRIMYDDRTVRVTNLSENTTEDGLTRLFAEFGYVTNVYIPVDGKTSGRAVGFVKFAHRREGEAAIMILNEDESRKDPSWMGSTKSELVSVL